jgi:hypothetical protein
MCIRALLQFASLRIDSLNLPIFSLLVTYIGNLENDMKIAQLAHSANMSALKEPRPHIQKVLEMASPVLNQRPTLK